MDKDKMRDYISGFFIIYFFLCVMFSPALLTGEYSHIFKYTIIENFLVYLLIIFVFEIVIYFISVLIPCFILKIFKKLRT